MEHKMDKGRALRRVLLFALAVLFAASVAMTTARAHSLSTEEIKQVQQCLKDWGYYTGNVDGIYGPNTTQAVKAFQEKNGLDVDGIVGSKTAEKLGIELATGKDERTDVYLLARLVYGEARGEPYEGQVAVAAVVLNRVEHAEFPNSIAGVIYQNGAFSVVADGQINLSPDAQALSAARDALNGVDPTGGCTFYYNPEKTSNKYMLSKPVLAVIGQHNFCK